MEIQDVINLNNNLLNTKQAAEYLGISPGTLAVWRCEKRYPLPYRKIGKCVRYSLDDLIAFASSETAGV